MVLHLAVPHPMRASVTRSVVGWLCHSCAPSAPSFVDLSTGLETLYQWIEVGSSNSGSDCEQERRIIINQSMADPQKDPSNAEAVHGLDGLH
jgi:hypothetical protein